MRVLNIHASYQGVPPTEGVMVCNHLTYIDIIVLSAKAPTVFVAKLEVRRWPIVGWLCACGGTLFINRQKRSDVKRLGAELEPVVSNHLVVCIFPEGTSSDGSEVLPFHSSLLAPATEQNWTVTPACVGYSIEDGSVADEICYWREMVFVPHLLNLLSKKRIDARVAYGPPAPPDMERKDMAKLLHSEVSELNRKLKRQ
jgi:1-acyl-sn-glycerol-3-phosphate acyltransferase